MSDTKTLDKQSLAVVKEGIDGMMTKIKSISDLSMLIGDLSFKVSEWPADWECKENVRLALVDLSIKLLGYAVEQRKAESDKLFASLGIIK